MNKILIICKEQFGYHTDVYKWCEYLCDLYDIKVITFGGKPRIELQGIRNVYISNKGSRIIRGIRFIVACLWHILTFRGVIMVCYFKECGILQKCFSWKRMILDIRTLDVSKNQDVRAKEDANIIKCANIYDYVTVISEGVREKLSLSKEKSAILPLGADMVSSTIKKFDTIKLLYVGTLYNRDIHKTIEGVEIVIKTIPHIKLHYDIIGNSIGNELEMLKNLVVKKNLEPYVTFHGYVPHEKLKTFLDSDNIGVSFIPKTEYYEHQPATKSFEYILSGLYTIATSTYCNREIISDQNGILIDDTPEEFAKAIITIYNNRDNIVSEQIPHSLSPYLWQNIILNKMCPILEQFNDDNQ